MNSNIGKVKGAINDVNALKNLLIQKFHFKEENISVLLNEQATYESILKSFDLLLEQSQEGPSLFYFAGNGSVLSSKNDQKESLTIVSADGRLDGVYDIDLSELSSRSSKKKGNLITIIDAGWTRNGDRTIDQDTRNRVTSRNFSQTRIFDELMIKIGCISIYPQSIEIRGSFHPYQTRKSLPHLKLRIEKNTTGF